MIYSIILFINFNAFRYVLTQLVIVFMINQQYKCPTHLQFSVQHIWQQFCVLEQCTNHNYIILLYTEKPLNTMTIQFISFHASAIFLMHLLSIRIDNLSHILVTLHRCYQNKGQLNWSIINELKTKTTERLLIQAHDIPL